jgi:hypothetical protein
MMRSPRLEGSRTSARQSTRGPKPSPRFQATRNLSDFPPLEQFQKQFAILEQQIHRLRQLSPPPEFHRVFSEFGEMKGKYLQFVEQCRKILKISKLRDPNYKVPDSVSQTAAAFPGQSNFFFNTLVAINSQKAGMFENMAFQLFSNMQKCVADFATLCEREQQSRRVYHDFESDLRSLLSNVKGGLDSIFERDFSTVDSDTVSALIESLKAWSRKFEVDLPHALHLQKLLLTGGGGPIEQFHASFVVLAPMMSTIPAFNQLLNEIFAGVDSYGAILKSVLRVAQINAVDPMTIPFVIHAHKPNSVVADPDFILDPLDHFISQLAELFECRAYQPMSKIDWYDKLLAKAHETVTTLQQQNHQLQTRVKSVDFITSERALNERFEGNRKYQEEISSSYEIQKTAFLRETVSSIRCLCQSDIIHPDDSPADQIRCIVSNCQMELDSLRKKVKEYHELVTQSMTQLETFSRVHLKEDLPENCNILQATTSVLTKAGELHFELEQSISTADPSVGELVRFLRNHLANQIDNIDEWTCIQLKHEFERVLSSSAQDLIHTKEEVQQMKESHTNYEKMIKELLIEVHDDISDSLGMTIDVTHSSFEILTKSIHSLLARSKEDSRSLGGFREFLASFLSQLLFAFQMPAVKFKGVALLDMKNVMVSILDSPIIQKRIGTGHSPRSLSLRVSRTSPTPIISSKDADAQFVLKIHGYIAECCAQLQASSMVSFLHLPFDKLMATLTKLIHERGELVLNLRGIIADVMIRISKRHKGQKESLMKRDIESLARELFSEIETMIASSKTDLSPLTSLIHPVSGEEYESQRLSPFESLKTELQRFAAGQASVEPFIAIIDSLVEDLSKSRTAFVPLSPYFTHFIARIEDMRRVVRKLSPRETHPLLFDLITKTAMVITACSVNLSAVSFMETFIQGEEQLADAISARIEMSEKVHELEAALAVRNQDLVDVKTQFSAFVTANKAQNEEYRKRVAEFHEKEISTIVDYYRENGQ